VAYSQNTKAVGFRVSVEADKKSYLMIDENHIQGTIMILDAASVMLINNCCLWLE
jgi:hypothetical protein